MLSDQIHESTSVVATSVVILIPGACLQNVLKLGHVKRAAAAELPEAPAVKLPVRWCLLLRTVISLYAFDPQFSQNYMLAKI